MNKERPLTHSFYAYAWDIVNDQSQALLDSMAGAGVSGISLAFSYHAGKFISPLHSTQRVIFPEDGSVYFKPDIEAYGSLKPLVATCIANTDPVARIRQHGMKVHAWTVLYHNTRLGQAHPHCTVKNAFGDHYPYSLCPSNPEVSDYAKALCTDIARQGVSSIKVETPGFLPFEHGYHHEFAQVENNAWLDNLLALCFCDHCKQKAKTKSTIDIDQLQQWVCSSINHYLSSSITVSESMARDWWLNSMVTNNALREFIQLRCDIVTESLKELNLAIKAIDNTVELRVIPTVQRPHANALLEGSDLAAISRVVDKLELPLYQPSTEACLADAWQVIQQVGSVDSLSAIIRPGPPDMKSPQQLKDTLNGLAQLNFRDISFYNFGLLRPQNHQWVNDVLSSEY